MHRNWKEICKLDDQGGGWYLKILLSLISPESPIGKRLADAFPECYATTEEFQKGPWSVIREDCRRNACPNQNRFPDELATSGTLDKYQIPYTRFSATMDNHKIYGFPILPKEVVTVSVFEKIVQFNGEPFVVVECSNSGELDEVVLSPLSYFDMNH